MYTTISNACQRSLLQTKQQELSSRSLILKHSFFKTKSTRSRGAGLCKSLAQGKIAQEIAEKTTVKSLIESGEAEILKKAQQDAQIYHLRDVVKDLKSGYQCVKEEEAFWVKPEWIEGRIPTELEGTLFRNGPGLFKIGEETIKQPLDGDGLICQLAFSEGQLHFRNKFVRTEGYLEEQEANKMLYSGLFSTGNKVQELLFNRKALKIKNAANTNVVCWGGKLYALWEGGLPHEIDPHTLETIGESTMDDCIDLKHNFGAHYKIIQGADGQKRFVNFGMKVQGTDAEIGFYEFDESGGLLHRSEITLPGAAFGAFHDFLVTENYYILFQNPFKMDMGKFVGEYVTGKCGLSQCLKFDDSVPARIHVIRRTATSSDPSRTPYTEQVLVTVPSVTLHHANAFETEDGKIICDCLPWQTLNFDTFVNILNPMDPQWEETQGETSELFRLELDLKRSSVRRTRLSSRICEFPAVNPRFVGKPHKHVYTMANQRLDKWAPNQTIMKTTAQSDTLDCSPKNEVWYAGARRFPGEPVFVPRPGGVEEDDGWVLAMVNDAATGLSDLVILDARNIAQDPLAIIHLPLNIPQGIHGSWTSDYYGPSEVPMLEKNLPVLPIVETVHSRAYESGTDWL